MNFIIHVCLGLINVVFMKAISNMTHIVNVSQDMIKNVNQNVVLRYRVLVQFVVVLHAVLLHNITHVITVIEEDIHIVKDNIDIICIQNTIDIMNIVLIKILLVNKNYYRNMSKYVEMPLFL